MTNIIDILDLRPGELIAELDRLGAESFRSRQVLEWIFAKGISDFEQMTNLPAQLREELAHKFVVGAGEIVNISRAESGQTAKILFSLRDNAQVEAVSMRDNGRQTACLSSQAGCAMGCAFCATGAMGFQRDLTAGEILLQMFEVSRSQGIVNRVVFMGMGEPLLNLENVLKAIDALMDPERFGLGGRRIAISTCGIVPGIEELARRDVPVRLALSLNSPFQEQREKLMPISKKFPLDTVLKACESYSATTNRRVSLEYVLLENENTSREAAAQVAGIASRLDGKVNLIEYNPVSGSAFASPTREETRQFRDWLKHLGVKVTIRYRRGRSIKAGCGQLAGAVAES